MSTDTSEKTGNPGDAAMHTEAEHQRYRLEARVRELEGRLAAAVRSDPPPKRRFEVEIHVSGDTWEDTAHAIRDLLRHIEEHGQGCASVGGGPSSGHWLTVTESPEITHEAYGEAVDRWLERRKAAKP